MPPMKLATADFTRVSILLPPPPPPPAPPPRGPGEAPSRARREGKQARRATAQSDAAASGAITLPQWRRGMERARKRLSPAGAAAEPWSQELGLLPLLPLLLLPPPPWSAHCACCGSGWPACLASPSLQSALIAQLDPAGAACAATASAAAASCDTNRASLSVCHRTSCGGVGSAAPCQPVGFSPEDLAAAAHLFLTLVGIVIVAEFRKRASKGRGQDEEEEERGGREETKALEEGFLHLPCFRRGD